MISHDRHVLKRVTTNTWLVEDREIRTYPFGFAKFSTEYDKEQDALEHLFHVQSKEHKRLKALVESFRARAASGPKAARYFHALEKRLARFESEMVKDPKQRDVHIELKTSLSGKKIKNKLAIMVKDVSFAYDQNEVFSNAEMYVEVGEKVALVSPNGTGKTTLIKLILGMLAPKEGVAKTGENLKVGYYSQEHLETLPS